MTDRRKPPMNGWTDGWTDGSMQTRDGSVVVAVVATVCGQLLWLCVDNKNAQFVDRYPC